MYEIPMNWKKGDKRDWFIRRIKAVYQVGEVEAERILADEEE